MKAIEPITLSAWRQMDGDARGRACRIEKEAGPKLNRQTGDSIEWARWSWNPVTGCLFGCPYCYARDIAERFYPQKFAPAIWPARLGAPYVSRPSRMPESASEAQRIANLNIFTCSMADLFGKWVPAEWIEAVLKTAYENPQFNFLLLTKNPARLSEFAFPANVWPGTTVDTQARVEQAEEAFAGIKAPVKWLSCEPMMTRLSFTRLNIFDWIVIGGASESTKTPAFWPPEEWIEHLEAQARAAGAQVFEKANLRRENEHPRLREYPGRPAELTLWGPP